LPTAPRQGEGQGQEGEGVRAEAWPCAANKEYLKAKHYLILTRSAFKSVELAAVSKDKKKLTRAVNRVTNYSIALYLLIFESGPHGFHTREIMEMEREAFILKEKAFALSVGWPNPDYL